MAVGYMEMLAAAAAEVRSVSVEEAAALAAEAGTVVVDVRDPRELEHGLILGARHAPRGMLEFWIDPESPYHKPWLAAQTAQRMGLRAASLDGGFGAWRAAGRPVAERRK